MDPEKVEIATDPLLPTDEIAKLTELFKLFGDPTRLRILYALVEAGELCVGDIPSSAHRRRRSPTPCASCAWPASCGAARMDGWRTTPSRTITSASCSTSPPSTSAMRTTGERHLQHRQQGAISSSRKVRVLRMNGRAILLYVVFAITAFGWRSWLQWRRTGDTGLRMHARPGTIQWRAKLGFVAALVAGVAAPLAGLAGLDPIVALDNNWLQVVGTILAVAGIAVTVAAQWQMGASWRIGVDPTERTGLVTGGVLGWVRSPIFTAMLVTAVGFALIVGNVVAIIGLAALIVAFEVQVRAVEEPYLTATNGSDYVSYASSTGRFVPGVGRLRAQ